MISRGGDLGESDVPDDWLRDLRPNVADPDASRLGKFFSPAICLPCCKRPTRDVVANKELRAQRQHHRLGRSHVRNLHWGAVTRAEKRENDTGRRGCMSDARIHEEAPRWAIRRA